MEVPPLTRSEARLEPQLTTLVNQAFLTDGLAKTANSSKDVRASVTDLAVQAGTLPALSIDYAITDNAKAATDRNASGVGAVIADLARGAINEITEHPGRLLGNAALGLATGVVATVLAPEILIVGAVAGIAYAAPGIYRAGRDAVHSAAVVANPEGHTQQEVQQAHGTLQAAGGIIVDAGAGIAGGGAAGLVRAGVAEAGAAVGARTGTPILCDLTPRPGRPTIRPRPNVTVHGDGASGTTAVSVPDSSNDDAVKNLLSNFYLGDS